MPYTFSDCKSCKSHINQQGNMAVTEIMYPDFFLPRFLTATVHLVGEIIFRYRENPVIRLQAVILFEKVLHLIT